MAGSLLGIAAPTLRIGVCSYEGGGSARGCRATSSPRHLSKTGLSNKTSRWRDSEGPSGGTLTELFRTGRYLNVKCMPPTGADDMESCAALMRIVYHAPSPRKTFDDRLAPLGDTGSPLLHRTPNLAFLSSELHDDFSDRSSCSCISEMALACSYCQVLVILQDE